MKGKVKHNFTREGLTVPENWVNIAREGISTSPWAGKKKCSKTKTEQDKRNTQQGNGAVPSPSPGIIKQRSAEAGCYVCS